MAIVLVTYQVLFENSFQSAALLIAFLTTFSIDLQQMSSLYADSRRSFTPMQTKKWIKFRDSASYRRYKSKNQDKDDY
jgi:hypothetical protein